MPLQKGERLKALILLGISPGSACCPVSTEEEIAARHAAERCIVFASDAPKWDFFFVLCKQVLKYCMLCIMA